MYMSGRLRTASSPSRTLMFEAVYPPLGLSFIRFPLEFRSDRAVPEAKRLDRRIREALVHHRKQRFAPERCELVTERRGIHGDRQRPAHETADLRVLRDLRAGCVPPRFRDFHARAALLDLRRFSQKLAQRITDRNRI